MSRFIRFLKYNRIRIIQIIFATIIVSFVFVGIWIFTPYKPTQSALSKLASTQDYSVYNTGNIEFVPTKPLDKGVIFYPGGRVEANSYSYICQGLSAKGYTCIIAVMPLNLAVFKINAASEIILKYNNIKTWVIGGHSLGGSMAARFTKDNLNSISGIFFLGSYSDIDLSKTELKAAVLIGSEDSVLNQQAFKDNYKNLPSVSTINIIQGGNHSQFGDYGLQDGDFEAKISKDEQHEIVINEVLKLLI